MEETKKYYVYFARCPDHALYIGKTSNLEKRIETHNLGQGARYIQRHGPAKIVYFEIYHDHLLAYRREKQLKRWLRKKKEFLILLKK